MTHNLQQKLKNAQESYETIVNRRLHYVFLKDNRYSEIILESKDENLMHLCGVSKYKAKPGMNEKKSFYSDLSENSINVQKVKLKKDGSAIQKLDIIGELRSLCGKGIYVIDYKIKPSTKNEDIIFDGALRKDRQIFCLGLVETGGPPPTFTPQSLYNLKSNPFVICEKGYMVHCIYEFNGLGELKVHWKSREFIKFEEKYEYGYQL